MGSAAKFLERLALWLKVRWSHWSLDVRLVGGEDSASDPALALRAAELTSVRHRRRLASWVERLVSDSGADGGGGVSAAAPVVREQVTQARDSLLSLAQTLRHAQGVSARGVAMVERLLTDAGSVIYTDHARGAVELQTRIALGYLVAGADDDSARSSASATPAGRPRLTQTA